MRPSFWQPSGELSMPRAPSRGLQPLVPLLLPDLAIALMGIFILVTQA
jgi:hypothetical protein